MKLKELLQTCLAYGCDGKDTDIAICRIGINVLHEKMPVLALQMSSVDELAVMMKSADNIHIFIEGGIFHFNALYNYKDNFPAVRIYFMKMEFLNEVAAVGVALQHQGIKLLPVNSQQFSTLIGDRHFPQRFRNWHADYKAESKSFSDLLDGRINNTAVERGIWLSAGGKCLICSKSTNRMATSTIINGEGTMIGMQMCKKHEEEAAREQTIMGYLAKKLGVTLPFLPEATGSQHNEQTLEITCEAIKHELGCEIEKIVGQTITARRPSGARVIIRQDSLDSYAYNIFSPDGKAVARIDSADHHDVNYGPAHIHRDLSKKNKNRVEPSYTYGLAIADLKIIKQLVEMSEKHAGKK